MIDYAAGVRRDFLKNLKRKLDRENALRPAQVVLLADPGHDWTKGLLVSAAFVLALMLIDALQIADKQGQDLRQAARDRELAENLRYAIDSAPQIRLESDGESWTCRHFKVRREWTKVMDSECARIGLLLKHARAAE